MEPDKLMNKRQVKTTKKIARDIFMDCDTRTKVVKSKKVYSRKEKHKNNY